MAPPSNSVLVDVEPSPVPAVQPIPVELFDVRRYFNKYTTAHFYTLESLTIITMIKKALRLKLL
jgi:hypothetical protein